MSMQRLRSPLTWQSKQKPKSEDLSLLEAETSVAKRPPASLALRDSSRFGANDLPDEDRAVFLVVVSPRLHDPIWIQSDP